MFVCILVGQQSMCFCAFWCVRSVCVCVCTSVSAVYLFVCVLVFQQYICLFVFWCVSNACKFMYSGV